MKKKDTITGTNIVEDNIINMVNNGDVNYGVSPCVTMNNLVKNHNQLADEMGVTSMSSSVIYNQKSKDSAPTKGNNLNVNLNPNYENEVKEYDPPVDYETAFKEYYPTQGEEK